VLGTLERLPDVKAGLLHSDQGVHYTNPQYIQRVEKLGLVQSMSRKGNCIDNAPMESFFGHFKDEVDFKDCKTFDELRSKIAEYIQYYNNERQQWNLKKMTPVEYRNHLLSAA
jgi:putative transposase